MNVFLLLFVSVAIFSSESCLAQKKENLNSEEVEYLQVFESFKTFLIKSAESQKDITDTASLKHVLLNFVVSEYNLDSTDINHFKKGEIPEESLQSFKKNFRSFYNYFQQKRILDLASHLEASPIRLSSDRCMYDKFIPFQKENTLVYFDARQPKIILGYLLFMPRLEKKSKAPRIWPWTLQFEAGYWSFKSPMGTLGMEHFISEGIKGPENPIGN